MIKKSPRHLARSFAVQGIYAHKLNPDNTAAIEIYLSNSSPEAYQKSNFELMHFLIENSINQFNDLLALYTPYLQRELSQVNLIEQVILVVAALELKDNLSVPATVVINEAVELAKLYGAPDSYKFINGLVDKLAIATRGEEIKHYAKTK